MKINEATSTDLKVIKELEKIGWKVGDTLLYQQEYQLTSEQQKEFIGQKSIRPDIVLQDLNGEILAVFENKLDNEKKALIKLRTLYYKILKPRFLYACSNERILFYDTSWKGLEAGEFRRVDSFMSLEEMKLKIEIDKKKNFIQSVDELEIDKTIVGGYDPASGKERYYQIECVRTLLEKYKNGKQRMLVHLATGLGKTRIAVALCKTLLNYGWAKRILFVVDRVILAKQAEDKNFTLISKDFPVSRLRTSNYKEQKHTNIHIIVIDTLENIYQDIPSNFYDLIIVDECHRSININRKLIFDHFLCPRIGLTATPRRVIVSKGKEISPEDLEILDTYRLFGCETGEPDYQFDLTRGIKEGFLAPYKPLEIRTYLTELAEKEGIEFSYVLDPDERKRIELDKKKKLLLEQLERKYISEERTKRIAEEIKKHTDYGEKMILFGVSQAHCLMLAKELNKIFEDNEELGPKYAEPIISDNNDVNEILKAWFEKPNKKPYIAVSVDIMSTGVDIPCVRYIGFAALTKSVGKYIQMLGRGTRLDPKSGKFSFKVLDFVGLCRKMEDNGQGTLKENVKIVKGTGKGGIIVDGPKPKGEWFLIDNPDPEKFIQRIWIHGDKIEIKDNIPINEARQIFENEAKKTKNETIRKIKEILENNPDYKPTNKEIEEIEKWSKDPEVFLSEEQLKKIYDFPQGTIWDFFLHAIGKRKIPTLKERIEKNFENFIATYNFNDRQIIVLKKMKNILTANLIKKKDFNLNDIFSNPVYELIIGKKNEIEEIFNNNFEKVINNFALMVKI